MPPVKEIDSSAGATKFFQFYENTPINDERLLNTTQCALHRYSRIHKQKSTLLFAVACIISGRLSSAKTTHVSILVANSAAKKGIDYQWSNISMKHKIFAYVV